MSKLQEEFINPLDYGIIKLADYLLPNLKKLNLTPNSLTTLSLIFGILCLGSLYLANKTNNYIILFSVFYLVSYFFDYIDGMYARRYKMVTKIGDLYDHIKDIIIHISLLYIVVKKYNISKFKNLTIFVLMFTFLQYIALSCQDKLYTNNPELSFKFGRLFCFNDKIKLKRSLKIYKWFDTTSWVLLITGSIIYIHLNDTI